jgi:hypothetical protein
MATVIVRSSMISLSEQLGISESDRAIVQQTLHDVMSRTGDFKTAIDQVIALSTDWSPGQCFMAGFTIGRLLENADHKYTQEKNHLPEGYHAS